ncbi:MAG: glycosyltransferase family 1 protein [Beijerinckiaceae bacterium]|nr:glycosyltransferase family 1 protein [Beijerinckiaceae bacterium]
MPIEFGYDYSSFSISLFQGGPTGISRVDLEGARYFSSVAADRTVGLHQLFGIRTRFSAARLARMVKDIDHAWGDFPDEDRRSAINVWLNGGLHPPRQVRHEHEAPLSRKALDLTCKWPWHDVRFTLPNGACYINTSYANTRSWRSLAWLRRRRGLRSVFVVHDLLPLENPDWFWDGLKTRFLKQIECILAAADGIVTPSETVACNLRQFLGQHGHKPIPVRAIHLPAGDAFQRAKNSEKYDTPYFVMCGTIEPRKNHKLIIDVWRKIIAQNYRAPKLIIFGKRGWRNNDVFSILDNDPSIKSHFLEISDISTDDLAYFLSGARALLMPSFNEGFGLPVVEAMRTKTRVIASDIPVFREIANEYATFVDYSDVGRWASEVVKHCEVDYGHTGFSAPILHHGTYSWTSFYDKVAEFARGVGRA